MEPVTHVLTGVCLARAGFNRKTAYALMAMAVAAEFPDIDMLWTLRGPVEGLTHHRGITHTFVGVPVEAALVVSAVWVWERWRGRSRGFPLTSQKRGREWGTQSSVYGRHESGEEDSSAALRHDKTYSQNDKRKLPVRWGWLYSGVLVALLSHLLLDFTNNYGIRPLFPFDAHWFAWSIVFIFDPLLFAMLLVALVAPLLFGLVGAEVGAGRTPFKGCGWAVAGLLGMVSLWGLRGVEHGRAVELAQGQTVVAPGMAAELQTQIPFGNDKQNGNDKSEDVAPVTLEARRTLASPDPLNPFRWSAVTDFGPVYRQAEVDSWRGTLEADGVLTPKPGDNPAMRTAEASRLGRAYLDWSPMPYLEESTGADGGVTIVLSDPRFMGGWMAAHGRSSLVGTVRENAQGRVVEQSLDGRVER